MPVYTSHIASAMHNQVHPTHAMDIHPPSAWPNQSRPNIPGWLRMYLSRSLMSQGRCAAMKSSGSAGRLMKYFVCFNCEKSPEHLVHVYDRYTRALDTLTSDVCIATTSMVSHISGTSASPGRWYRQRSTGTRAPAAVSQPPVRRMSCWRTEHWRRC